MATNIESPQVIRALEELDDDALTSLPIDKLPAFKRAVKKEYQLSDDEVDYVVEKKTAKPTKAEPASPKLPPATMREKKIRGGVDTSLRASADGIRAEQNQEFIDPVSKGLMVNPVLLPCMHSVSENSLATYMEKYNNCPVCKKDVNLNDVRPNFTLRNKLAQQMNKDIKEKEILTVSSTCGVTSVPPATKQEVLVMTSLVAPALHKPPPEDPADLPTLGSEAPMTILAVVDCSTSLNRELFQNGIKFVLSQLNEKDHFGLLSYAGEIKKQSEITKLTMEGRTRILSTILDMQTASSKGDAMADALVEGVQMLQKFQKGTKEKQITSIVLFSNSKPNVPRDEIIGVLNMLRTKTPWDFNICTFGLAPTIDPVLMSAIAKLGNGSFYYVDKKEEFDLAVADYLGGLMSVFAQDVKIAVKTGENVVLKQLQTPYFTVKNQTPNGAEIYIGNMSLEERRDILLQVEVPTVPGVKNDVPIVTFDFSYYNTYLSKTEDLSSTCNLSRKDGTPTVSEIVNKHDNRIMVANAMLKISEKPNESAQVVKDVTKRLMLSPSASTFLVMWLVNNFAEFADKKNASLLYSAAVAHFTQRSTHAIPLYITYAKSSTVDTLKTFSERKTLRKQRAVKKKNVSVKESVALPPGYPKNDWLAEHVETFQEQVQRMFQPIEEKCTTKTCPEMTAGPRYSFLWADEKQTEPISLPAKQYIHTLLDWVVRLSKDEKIFPPRSAPVSNNKKSLRGGKVPDVPKQFLPTVKNIFRRLFRVFAHIYYHHFEDIRAANLEQELNSTFKWFYYFAVAFELVEKKDLEPLQELIDTFN